MHVKCSKYLENVHAAKLKGVIHIDISILTAINYQSWGRIRISTQDSWIYTSTIIDITH